MKRCLLFTFLFFSMMAKSQTIEVSGLQSGFWSADTVLVTGDVVVEGSLNIGPGTTVLFDGYYGISVKKGSLHALGAENDTIVFTVSDTTGFHIFDSGKGSWNGIRIDQAESVRFDYCKFQFAKASGDKDQDGGALKINGSYDVEISNSNLYSNCSREHGGALCATRSIINMHDCTVSRNYVHTEIDSMYYMYGGAMFVKNCKFALTDMVFRNNDGSSCIGGALCMDSTAVTMDRCVFDGNHGLNGGAFYLMDCNDKVCSISNCLVTNNLSNHFGGGFALRNASPSISNVTVAYNRSIGVNVGGIFFYQNCAARLYNCILWGNCSNDGMIPIQMWLWIYEDNAPSFYNCLSQGGLEMITGVDFIKTNENMMTDDPLFVEADNNNFRLSPESPCIDAGSPRTSQEVLAGLDLDKKPRVSGKTIDLGTFEHDQTGTTENRENDNRIVIAGNPLNASSCLELTLQHESAVTAKVYAENGILLWTKDFGVLPADTHRIAIGELDTKLPHGMFLLEILTDEGAFTTKMVK